MGIIIIALEKYNEGLKPLKNFVDYKPFIRRLVNDLQTERATLKSTCELLLISLSISNTELACLLADPASSAWREQSLVKELKQRLQSSYTVFLNILEEIAGTLGTLANIIGFDSEGQPFPDFVKKRKRYWKRFSACLALKEHEALILRVKRANGSLSDLVKNSLALELPRSHRKNQKASFRDVRDCAQRLHTALRSRWPCSCSVAHHAELRLERRVWDQPPSFRVTFPITVTPSDAVPSRWHETEIKSSSSTAIDTSAMTCNGNLCDAFIDTEPVSSSTIITNSTTINPISTPRKSSLATLQDRFKSKERKRVGFAAVTTGVQVANLHFADVKAAQSHAEVKQQAKHIDDLCSILRHTNEGSANSLLGQFAHDQCQYEMVSISQQVRSENDTTTFHDMLLNHQQEAPSPGDNDTSPSTSSLSGYTSRLTRKARLQLAVILASTTLQLHTTPWLDSDWSGKDVLFRQGSFDSPYISHAFMKSEQPPSMHNSLQPQWGPVRNLTIFRLGILLLELSLGKPLGTWKSNEPEERYQDFVRASKLVGALMNEESQSYIGATQACIYGNFGSKAKDLNLEDDAFRRAVYEDVVLPLEQDLQYFCQGIGQPC